MINTNMDKISSLPYEILIHILSFLKTKEAVQTCILSKRWRDTWAFLPVLKFDIVDWVGTIIDDKNLREANDKFEKFLNGVLENRKSAHLDMFLYNNDCPDHSHYEISLEFLDHVALLKPRVVSVYIYSSNRLELPDSIFFCTSLEKLCLHIDTYTANITYVRPKAVHLPSLKVLELKGTDISIDDGFIRKILLGCPVLETLVLKVFESEISEISSNVLKKLSFKFFRSTETRICCPNLASLVIRSDDRIPSLKLGNMPFLEYAKVSLEDDVGEDINILNGLSNVSNLCLGLWGSDFKAALAEDIYRCKTFSNLKILEFEEWSLNNDMSNLLAYFLMHSPRLEELTLYLTIYEDDIEEEPNQEELENVLFRREYLEKVRIEILYDKNCSVTVDRLIKFLHTHVKIIRNIIIS